MEASERADRILKDLRERFLIGGQQAKFLRLRIIEEIISAETATRDPFPSLSKKKEVIKDVKD